MPEPKDMTRDELESEVARLRAAEAAAKERAERAEKDLHASRAIFSATIESLPFDFWARDAAGYCFSQNATTRANWGDLLAKRPEDMGFAPDVVETWLANNRRALAGEIVREDVEFVMNGETRHIHNVISPIRMEDSIVGVVGVNIDVTERRRAEEERLKLELRMRDGQRLESLGLLAGGVAHDFNNLLTIIFASVSAARRTVANGGTVGEELESIEEAGRRAAELCAQLLAYAGRCGGTVHRRNDLASLVRDTAHLVRSSIPSKIDIRLDVESSPLIVEVDAAQVRQVIMNLVINAGEAIGDRSGKIVIAAREVNLAEGRAGEPFGRHAELTITDDGCGMNEETRARIFEPFFTTKYSGRGLGLAAVDGIVRSHRGALRVESAVGAGTTFHLLLPMARSQEVDAPRRAAHSEWRGEGTILIVDDEDPVRRALSRAVQHLGFSAVEAKDGVAALELARGRPDIAIVLLDAQMPRMDGHEVIRHLRAVRSELPVVMMSGFDEATATDPVGASVAFLAKPFTGQELAVALRSALAAR